MPYHLLPTSSDTREPTEAEEGKEEKKVKGGAAQRRRRVPQLTVEAALAAQVARQVTPL